MFALASTVATIMLLAAAPQQPMLQGPLRITVRGPDGRPYKDAVVQVLRSAGDVTYSNLDLGERERVRTVAKLPTTKGGNIGVQVPVAIPHRICVDVEPFAVEWRAGVYAGDEVEIQLRQGAVLEGTVRDDAGNAIPAEEVLVMTRGYPTAGRTYTVAGADGRFRIDRLMPGNHYVDADSARGARHEGKSVVLASGETTTVDFVLDRGATMRGRITDKKTGEPIAGAVIGVGWTFNKPVTSDADGRYELHGLGGPYSNNLFVMRPGYVEFQIQRPRQKQGEVRIDVQLERGITVAGRVVDAAGRPVAGCYVAVVGMTHDGQRQETDWLSARTDADGRYTIGDVRELLDPIVMVRHDGAATWIVDVPRSQHGKVDMPDVQLQPRRIVQGVLRDAAGDPMPGSSVELHGVHEGAPPRVRPGGGMISGYLAERTVHTDRLGRFFFGDLGPGTYTLVCNPFQQEIVVRAGEDPAPIVLEH